MLFLFMAWFHAFFLIMSKCKDFSVGLLVSNKLSYFLGFSGYFFKDMRLKLFDFIYTSIISLYNRSTFRAYLNF